MSGNISINLQFLHKESGQDSPSSHDEGICIASNLSYKFNCVLHIKQKLQLNIYISEYLSIGFTLKTLLVLTDSILISGSTGKARSLLFCKSTVVFIISLDLLEHTVLLSGTSTSLVWSSVFKAAVGCTASDCAPIVALGPVLGRGAGFGFLEKVADFSEIDGIFRVFPFRSANFALKAQ